VAKAAPAKPAAKAKPTATPKPVFDAAGYFKGKTIKVVVAWDPGNSIDAHGRAVARYLPRHIPGNPRTVVVNKDGAAGTTGGNWWHDNSKSDGLWLFANTGANPVSQLLRPGVRYDFREYTSVGGIMQRTTMWMIHGEAPYSRIQEASSGTEEFTVGLNTQSDPGTAKALAIGEWLNLPMKPIYGIGSGFSAFLTTMDRKDAHSYITGSGWYRLPGSRPGWLKEGTVKPFAMLGARSVFGNNGEIDVPSDLKTIGELLSDEQKALWEGMTLDDTSFYRGIFTRSDTPPEVLKVLRKAFQDMLADPEYLKIYEQLVGLAPGPGGALPPEEVNAALKSWEANTSAIKATYEQFLP
jgi:tripartite-type tricarboxylate transporter receptor subunit TctC